MALTAIRYGAQNSVAIGGTAEITGLEPVGGSIQNDPNLTSARPKFRTAASPDLIPANPLAPAPPAAAA
jgi:hypothetical protein